MISDFSSLRFSSLKSFGAPRQTPNVALRTWEPVHALGFPSKNCVFCLLALGFHIDIVSRQKFLASNFGKYTTVVRNQTTIKNTLLKSSPITFFIIYTKCSHLLFMFLYKCSSAKRASLRRADRPCGQSLGLQE